ncbi:MAG: hypothetical protein GXP33_02475 [Spirochaetes bacterium]|nr:hypothetical protein [Spirochaetota bacterium]
MSFKSRAILILMFLLGAGFVMAEEPAAGQGVITGRVVNASSDNSPLFNGEVSLQTYSKMTLSNTKTVKSYSGGHFSFKGLKTGKDVVYIVSVNYRGVGYSSDPIVLNPKVPSHKVTLPVYEITGDNTKLLVVNHHMIISPAEKGIQVEEIMVVRNSSPFTYKGKDGLTLKLSLPSGAYNVHTGGEVGAKKITITGDSVLVYKPITPQGLQIVYSYELKTAGSSFTLIRPIDYTTEKVDVFLKIPEIRVKSDQLKAEKSFTADNIKYLHLSGKKLAPGDPLEIRIENLPGGKIDFFKAGALSLIFLIIIMIVVYIIYQKRKKVSVKSNEDLFSEKEALIKDIALLDDEYSKGNITEEEYRSVRENKKKRLLDITHRISKIR